MKRFVALGILLIVVFAVLGFTWWHYKDEEGLPGFRKDLLLSPSNRSLPAPHDPPPQNLTTLRVPYSFKVLWVPLWEGVYTDVGGVYKVKINNTGKNSLYVVGVTIHLGDESSTLDVRRYISGEEVLGIMHVSGPSEPGNYTLYFELDIFSGEKGRWHHYGSVTTEPTHQSVESLPLWGSFSVRRDSGLYRTVNGKIWDEIGEVRNFTRWVLGEHTGVFGVDQVILLYQWVEENIEYISDPGGVANYWASPMETLRMRAGDCEDVAMLLGAMLTSIGGSVRVVVAEDHAYLMLYAGEVTDDVISALHSSYSSSLSLAFFRDSLGFWLILDPLSHSYPGSLPLSTLPSLEGGADLLPGGYHFGYSSACKVLIADIYQGGNV